MRGSRLAPAATFLLCLTAPAACQPPGSSAHGRRVRGAAAPRGVPSAGSDLLQRLGVRFFAPELGTCRGNAETVPRRPLSVPAYRTAQQAGLPARVKDLDESWSISAATL